MKGVLISWDRMSYCLSLFIRFGYWIFATKTLASLLKWNTNEHFKLVVYGTGIDSYKIDERFWVTVVALITWFKIFLMKYPQRILERTFSYVFMNEIMFVFLRISLWECVFMFSSALRKLRDMFCVPWGKSHFFIFCSFAQVTFL